MIRYAFLFIRYDKPKSIGVVLGIIISILVAIPRVNELAL